MPPWRAFRFQTRELEAWFIGRPVILTRGTDFPSDAPFLQLKRRLEQAARNRVGTARVWQVDEDHVGVILTPNWEKLKSS